MKSIIMRGDQGADTLEIVDDLEHADNTVGPSQVRVEVKAAGVCGSDLSCSLGKYYMPTPMAIGHEGAGVVTEIGSAVSGCAVGDHVVLSTLGECGHCDACSQGAPTLCGTPGALHQPFVQGGEPIYQFANVSAFTEEVIVKESQCIPIPTEVPFSSAALIGCGVITGAGAVLNRAKVRAGDRVVVIGAGGVGLNVIQAAALSGARQIVAVDQMESKAAQAAEFGATDFVHVGGDADSNALVRKVMPTGADHTFEVVGHNAVINDAIAMTAPGGNVVAVGVPPIGSEYSFPAFNMYQNKNLLFVRYGGARPRYDFAMIAELYLQGRFKLDELVAQTAGFDGIGEALASLQAGAEGRTILIP